MRSMNDGASRRYVNGVGYPQVALVVGLHEDRPSGEQEANARLIAAAPDLLAALERIVSWYDGSTTDEMVHREPRKDPPRITAARAAVAKAKGEG